MRKIIRSILQIKYQKNQFRNNHSKSNSNCLSLITQTITETAHVRITRKDTKYSNGAQKVLRIIEIEVIQSIEIEITQIIDHKSILAKEHIIFTIIIVINLEIGIATIKNKTGKYSQQTHRTIHKFAINKSKQN